jgi:hypothetical protein
MPETKVEELREQAARCRRLSQNTTNHEIGRKLVELAEELEAKAVAEEARSRR